jgi:hypothetical protein
MTVIVICGAALFAHQASSLKAEEGAVSSSAPTEIAIPVTVPADRYSGLLARSPFVLHKQEAPQVIESNFGQNYKLVSLMKLGEVTSAVLLDNATQQYFSVTSSEPEKKSQIQIESVVAQGSAFQKSVVLRRGQERATVQLDSAGMPVAQPIKTFHSQDSAESRSDRRREVESNFVPFDPQVKLHDTPLKLRNSESQPFSEGVAYFYADDAVAYL